jgi:hypothetical protein
VTPPHPPVQLYLHLQCPRRRICGRRLAEPGRCSRRCPWQVIHDLHAGDSSGPIYVQLPHPTHCRTRHWEIPDAKDCIEPYINKLIIPPWTAAGMAWFRDGF